MIADPSGVNLRAAARWGVGAAIVVTIGSAVANTYTAAARVADGVGGWTSLGWEGWLNVVLNAGLSLGSEALGFLALGFLVAYCFARQWVNAAAILAVFVVALIVNGSNSHDFVMKQERQAAAERMRKTDAWSQVMQDKTAAEREIARTGEKISPKALREKLAQLQADRAAALRDARYLEARYLRKDIQAAREELASAVSLAEAAAAAQSRLQSANVRMARLEASAAPTGEAETRAWTILIAVEIIKSLGLFGFTVPRTTEPSAAQPSAGRTTAPAKKAALTAEQKRARQRAYTAKWRAKKALQTAA